MDEYTKTMRVFEDEDPPQIDYLVGLFARYAKTGIHTWPPPSLIYRGSLIGCTDANTEL